MSEKNTGGQAFPEVMELVKSTDGYPHYKVWGSEGMTLRDYFASKVLQGMCARGDHSHRGDDLLTKDAYSLADAMLRARGTK